MNPSHPFDLLIGLDRSDQKADLHLINTRTDERQTRTVPTNPEAVHELLTQLRLEHPTARVAVCVEQPAINIIAMLEVHAWITLFAINPMTLKKFREAFVTSRANDDAKDAYHLAELLLTHHDKLSAWMPEDADTRRLQYLISDRRAVVDERTEFTNRLQDLLKQFFPQSLELCGNELWRPLATSFLLKWPTLQLVKMARPATLRQFYYRQGSRSQVLVDERLALVERALPLSEDAALLDTCTLRVQLVCRQLQLVVRAIADYDRQIEVAFANHPDREIFASLPGAGAVLGPRLLGGIGTQRGRFAKSTNLQKHSGIAPVTKQSGKKKHIHRRYCCPRFLRQSFHEHAGHSILQCRWAAAYYQQQRDKGAEHHTAVRALAFKWQRIIWKCWQDHAPYSDAIYEAALKRRGSPLAARLESIEVGKNPVKSAANKS